MTPFEQAVDNHKKQLLKAPLVFIGKDNVDFFTYQLRVHKFNLSLMAKGMTFRGIKFKEIKAYYGLKGRGAKDCIEEFEKIVESYTALGEIL